MTLDGDLARSILQTMAALDDPILPNISRRLNVDVRRVKKHLEALEILMVVTSLSPLATGIGKQRYYLFDSGLAAHFGASIEQQVLIWALNECAAQHDYSGQHLRLKYYRTPRGSHVDFVIEQKAQMTGVVVCHDESVNTYVLRTGEAFLKKNPNAKVIVLAPTQHAMEAGKNMLIVPWREMA